MKTLNKDTRSLLYISVMQQFPFTSCAGLELAAESDTGIIFYIFKWKENSTQFLIFFQNAINKCYNLKSGNFGLKLCNSFMCAKHHCCQIQRFIAISSFHRYIQFKDSVHKSAFVTSNTKFFIFQRTHCCCANDTDIQFKVLHKRH